MLLKKTSRRPTHPSAPFSKIRLTRSSKAVGASLRVPVLKHERTQAVRTSEPMNTIYITCFVPPRFSLLDIICASFGGHQWGISSQECRALLKIAASAKKASNPNGAYLTSVRPVFLKGGKPKHILRSFLYFGDEKHTGIAVHGLLFKHIWNKTNMEKGQPKEKHQGCFHVGCAFHPSRKVVQPLGSVCTKGKNRITAWNSRPKLLATEIPTKHPMLADVG